MIDKGVIFDACKFKKGWRELSILCESMSEYKQFISYITRSISSLYIPIHFELEVARIEDGSTAGVWFWCTYCDDDEFEYELDCCDMEDAVAGPNDIRFSDIIWVQPTTITISKSNLMEFLCCRGGIENELL